MDGEWPEQYNDLYNWLGLGYPGGDNQVIQHNLGAEVNGLPGAAANMGNNTNAAAADQGNGGGQANGDQTAGTRERHFRRRHTVEQIQILEAAFKEGHHPDEKRRLELSRRTGLSPAQVQIWFQNRRNSGKSKAQKKETEEFQQENDRLQAEKQALMSAMQNKICIICRGEDTPERQRLYAENMMLKDAHMRIADFLKNVSGGRLQVINHTVVDTHAPLTLTGPNPVTIPDHGIARDNPETEGNALAIQHVACAMEEFKVLVGLGAPVWSLAEGGEVEVINYKEYLKMMFPNEHHEMEFGADGTRKTGIISCTATDLVGILMNADWWSQTFPGIVASATTSKVITPGDSGDGMVQLMNAELRVLSPRVPVRKINFIRHCQKIAENIWAVVDVSVDGIRDQAAGLNDGAPSTYTACKLQPSGCHIQELSNGHCQVTWIVNMVHDEATVPPLHHPLFRSGWALGACRWIASLQRRCEYIASLHTNPVHTLNNRSGGAAAITAEGRKNVLEVAHRMTLKFYEAICGRGSQPGRSVDERRGSCGVGTERYEVAVRVVTFPVGRGVAVLRATTTVWLPRTPAQRVFNYLCDADRRTEWDISAKRTSTIRQEGCFSTGEVHGNSASLLRTIASNGAYGKLILQESSIDASCMVLAYAPIDDQSVEEVMNGTNISFSLLPSGVVVLPDGNAEPGAPPTSAMCSSSSSSSHRSNSGSLVSTMYQTLLSGQPPEHLFKAVAENVGNLLCQAIDKIKSGVHANVVLSA
ncbi:homeobox-leucine zipper protein ROC6-like [Triticum dicoccoides]|uniref:homeobox-leucine zipper protein ROC6-like n=1 Tax=Triticum dicoccoides TaxID=85692 RepID=UPI000E7C7D07|nr:homeobox-leucine zipper protein ROC6-like [Triticum dicoccoides]